MTAAIDIVATGAVTALGLTAATSAAAVRARISRVQDHPSLITLDGDPVRMACVPQVSSRLRGWQRLVALAQPALRSALYNALGERRIQGVLPVFVSLPEHRPGFTADDSERIVDALTGTLAERATEPRVVVGGRGHAGGIVALAAAAQQIRARLASICVVLGVDSYRDGATCEWLDKNGQLAGGNKRGGFVPGEGAGALVVVGADVLAHLRIQSQARLLGIHCTREHRLIKTDHDNLGQGLAAAIERATSTIGKMDNVYCDINGERYRSDEWSLALLRTQATFRSFDYESPSDLWGDVGAASGPLLSILAIRAWARGYARGPLALVWGSSEGGDRAAVVLQKPHS